MIETSTILTERKRCDERLALKGGESYRLQATGFRLRTFFYNYKIIANIIDYPAEYSYFAFKYLNLIIKCKIKYHEENL